MSAEQGKNLLIDGLALVMNRDGGETITEYARSAGMDAACALFREWLTDRIELEDLAAWSQALVQARRQRMRIVPANLHNSVKSAENQT